MTVGLAGRAGGFLLTLAVLAYPLAVYFLMDAFGPLAMGLLLLILLIPRVALVLRWNAAAILVVAVVGLAYFALLLLADTALIVKLYPTLISLGLLTAFAYTLIRPPSMIQRLAQGMGLAVSQPGVGYTRVLTMLWCIFFGANASVATLTAIYGSMESWTLYNGFLSYVIIGVLALGEFIYRQFYKRRKARSG